MLYIEEKNADVIIEWKANGQTATSIIDHPNHFVCLFEKGEGNNLKGN